MIECRVNRQILSAFPGGVPRITVWPHHIPADFENGCNLAEQAGGIQLNKKCHFVSELTGLGAPTFTAVIGLVW